jgi:hemolysin III
MANSKTQPILSRDGSIHVTNELINTVTSIIGACFAILGSAILIVESAIRLNVWAIVGFSIYGAALISLFVSSALHHGIDGSPTTNRRLRTFDYLAVFLLIAGSITPVVLVRARNPIGWSVFGTVWAISLFGITLRAIYHQLPRFVSNTLYIVLGWLAAVIAAANLHLPIGGYVLLVLGGLIYSVGFAMFVVEKPNLKPGLFGFHELWHLLVMSGALCHFMLMYFYILN